MVVDRDLGMKRIRENLRYLEQHSLKFGWVSKPDPTSRGEGAGGDPKDDDEGNKTDVSVAYIARAHELGLGPLKSVQPPRSAIVKTLDEQTTRIEEAVFELIGPAVEGQVRIEIAIRLLGEFMAELIRQQYRTQAGWQPLTEARKAQKVRGGKSGNQARIYTGQEVNAIRYEVGNF